ncbi:hypothetical protein EV175_003505 [Coemansia sp. RSA 1933]|nr:hypothetical protein EV175_003505 [Coemansia sp. RSA 1933]
MGGSGIGPQIPPEIAARLGIKGASNASNLSSDEESPAVSKSNTIGPTMPPTAITVDQSPADDDSNSDNDDDDSAAIGPSVALAGCTGAQALNQTLDSIEARASSRDADKAAQDTGTKRPDWMLVPPDSETRKTGLFDESWTRTPGQTAASGAADQNQSKRRKKKTEDEDPVEETPDMRRRRLESEDKARWVDEYNKQVRPKSLLEMHRETKRSKEKTLKKAKRRDGDDSDDGWQRHRFDRSRDLSSAPRPADAKRQRELLNTMGFLADKYTRGKGS